MPETEPNSLAAAVSARRAQRDAATAVAQELADRRERERQTAREGDSGGHPQP